MKKILKSTFFILITILLLAVTIIFNTKQTYAEDDDIQLIDGEFVWAFNSKDGRPDGVHYKAISWTITITNLDTGKEIGKCTVYEKDSEKAKAGNYVGFYTRDVVKTLGKSKDCKSCENTPGKYKDKACPYCKGTGKWTPYTEAGLFVIPFETVEKLTKLQLTQGNFKYTASATVDIYMKNKDGTNNYKYNDDYYNKKYGKFNGHYTTLASLADAWAYSSGESYTDAEKMFKQYFNRSINICSYAVWVHDTENKFDLSKIKLITISNKTEKTTYGTSNSKDFFGWADKDTLAKIEKEVAQKATKTGYSLANDCILKVNSVTKVSHIYLKAVPNTNTVTYDLNGGEGDTPIGFTHTYGTVDRIDATNPVRAGYTFDGWYSETTKKTYNNGDAYYDDFLKKVNVTGKIDTLTAQWIPNTYTVEFYPNGGEGVANSISVTTGKTVTMITNPFICNDCSFMGWGLDSGAVNADFNEGDEIAILDLAKGFGVQYEPTATIPIYALWDAMPRISAEDRYFSLDDARDGYITPEELFKKASAYDTEDGEILPSEQFYLESFTPDMYTDFSGSGYISETFVAIDSAGNKTKKMILVHITDTQAQDSILSADNQYVRSISLKYVDKAPEEGGLMLNSIWRDPVNFAYLKRVLSIRRVNPQVNTVSLFGFTYSKEVPGTGEWSDEIAQEWVFTKADVDRVKAYVDEHGFGNFKEPDALAGFLEEFADCRKK